jgi:hypothetical protein
MPTLTSQALFATALGAALVAGSAPPVQAQRAAAPAAADLSPSPFRPLELPSPNQYRTGSGRPGAAYWQQSADYRIAATLDPATHELRGRETIRYTNRSPDVLGYIWLHVEQNICAPGSVANQLDQPPLVFLSTTFDFSCKDFRGGPTLDSLRVAGQAARGQRFGTTLRVDLPQPLRSGGVVELDLAWHFPVPPYGAGRMGRDSTHYQIAQWYPRIAVYDDIRGWNHEPYIGAGEFYLEYGRFDVALTVPATFLVAATGTLQNPAEVLTAAQLERLARAARSDTAIAIVTAAEAGDAAQSRPRTDGTLTWRFTADSVRDFAFAAGPTMRWDASAWEGVMVHTLYRPAATLWPEANRMVREGLRHFSERWMRYPYPHISSVEGPIEGMEYPMLTFDPAGPSREELHWVLAHELGHMWMPMIVGSNERLYPWMDEGFNTFIDLENAAAYFSGTPYGDTITTHPLRLSPGHTEPGRELPLISRPVEVTDLFWTGYQKPALMLSLLRDEVLGRERFEHAFREYMRAWAFRHPAPADFYRMMRDASGMDLDWFWRGWVYTTARLDQAVESVVPGREGAQVRLASRGSMVMPLEMDVSFADGRRERIRLPVEMWNLGPRFTWRAPAGSTVTRVEIDPRRALPDVSRGNNVWAAGGRR